MDNNKFLSRARLLFGQKSVETDVRIPPIIILTVQVDRGFYQFTQTQNLQTRICQAESLFGNGFLVQIATGEKDAVAIARFSIFDNSSKELEKELCSILYIHPKRTRTIDINIKLRGTDEKLSQTIMVYSRTIQDFISIVTRGMRE